MPIKLVTLASPRQGLVNLADEVGITDTAVICAALLHDTVEDRQTTADELLDRFGAEIAGIVAEVTDDKSLAKHERKLRQIDHAKTASEKARSVKRADKIAICATSRRLPRRIGILPASESISIGRDGSSTQCAVRTPRLNHSSTRLQCTGKNSRGCSLNEIALSPSRVEHAMNRSPFRIARA